ncbi:MAG: hypothetical protein R2753_16415 [Chitinophagales bacterium]
MKIFLFKECLFALLFFAFTAIQAQQQYSATIDLTKVENDQLKVDLDVPELEGRDLLFVFPKVVPGTYDEHNYGRFISHFKAYTASGKKVRVKKNDATSFLIKKAGKVDRISYLVDDTWDDFDGVKYVFQPGGTNINAGKQFVLNNFGFFGYFQDYPKLPYELRITKPENFYGATSLDRTASSDNQDVFLAENYVELVDQPIMYAKPDTSSYYEGGAKIGIAVYSPNESINAAAIQEVLKPLTAATSFILGKIPTDEYWFIFHFFDLTDEIFRKGGGAYGALEHKKSSFYYLPLIPSEDGVNVDLALETVSDVASHEFLHVLVPLNLHSEEIAYFDFYDTKMSKHLWLYEGVTEYLSIKSRLIGGLLTMDDFTTEMQGKIASADAYKDISFTQMSKNILDKEVNKEYGNVYLKGALIAMLLDIKIAKETNGKHDLIDLVLELITDYGMNKPFKDDELFDAIAAKTTLEIRQFFAKYVEGDIPLPYDEILNLCGLEYTQEYLSFEYTFGNLKMKFDSDSDLLIITPEIDNKIITEKLAISKLNGESLSFKLVRSLLLNPTNNEPLTIEHIVDGKTREQVLIPEIEKGSLEYVIKVKDDMTPEQQMLFNRLFTKTK